MSNKIEPTVGGTATKESTGFLGGLFGGKEKGPRSVSAILGTFTTVVDELKTAIKHHEQKKEANRVEVERLNADTAVSDSEIEGAEHAIENITTLISKPAKA